METTAVGRGSERARLAAAKGAAGRATAKLRGRWRGAAGSRAGSRSTRGRRALPIVLGVVLLCDQLNNYGDIVTWLSDSGILPRYAVLEHHWAGEPWRHSGASRGRLARGTDAFVMLVFHANLLTLCAFIVGFHTHAATIAAFVFQVSQHNRNAARAPRLRLPRRRPALLVDLAAARRAPSPSTPSASSCGRCARASRRACGSAPRRRRRCAARRRARCSRSARSRCGCRWVMYFCAMSSKTDKAWTRDHTALQLAIQVGYLARQPIAAMVLRQEGLCRLLTALTFPAEYVLPLMLLLPPPPPLQLPIRLPAMLGMAGFHFGIGLTMELGEIPWLNISAILPFLPPAAWELIDTQLLPRLRKPRRGPSRHIVRGPDEPLAALAIALVFETQRIVLGRPGALCLTTRTDLAKNGGGGDDDVDVGDGGEHGMLRDHGKLRARKATRSRCCRAMATAATAAPRGRREGRGARRRRRRRLLAPAGRGGVGARALRAQCGGCGRARGDVAGAVGGGEAEAAVRRCDLAVRCGAPSRCGRSAPSCGGTSTASDGAPAVRPSFALPLQVFNLHQSFKVFAPRPPTEDYYERRRAPSRTARRSTSPGAALPRGRAADPRASRPTGASPPATSATRPTRAPKIRKPPDGDRGSDQAKKPRHLFEAQRLAFGKWVSAHVASPLGARDDAAAARATFIRLDNNAVLLDAGGRLATSAEGELDRLVPRWGRARSRGVYFTPRAFASLSPRSRPQPPRLPPQTDGIARRARSPRGGARDVRRRRGARGRRPLRDPLVATVPPIARRSRRHIRRPAAWCARGSPRRAAR